MTGPRHFPSPGSKLTGRQRQLLGSQGRCFKCHKKGHRAQECKRKAGSSLAQLPVELLNEICSILVYPDGKEFGFPFAFFMMALRLTCRELNSRTYEFFTKTAFKTVFVNQSYKGFRKLTEISQCAPCVSKIERLSISAYDQVMDNQEYEELQRTLSSGLLSRKQRREISTRLREANREQTDKAFFEGSPAGGIMLTLALQKMPNLRTILIHPVDNRRDRRTIRQAQSSNSFTTTHVFSMVLSSLALAGARPHALQLALLGYGCPDLGVSIQALSVPRDMLRCVSELRKLKISLETNDCSYKNPDTWTTYASTFLTHMPLLTELWLGFSDIEWKDSAVVFGEIVSRTTLPHLESLTLDGMRCTGEDLAVFLVNKNRLQCVELKNLDILGPVSFANILGELESLDSLSHFYSYQVAQDGFRTLYRTYGNIEFNSERHLFGEGEDQDGFFDDFVFVKKFRYAAKIEQWEGVQRMLGDLKQDVIVTSRTYRPDYNFGSYIWIDR